MKDAQCTAIYGRRGSGKSTLAKRLIGKHRRVVVFDPMGEYAALSIFRRADSVEEVRRLLRAGWARGFKIAYVPRADHKRSLHILACLIWDAQAPYDAGQDTRKILLVVEEMNLGYPASKLPSDLYGMTQVVLQGRHRGVGVIGITQRPALVSLDFRGQVAETYVLPLSAGQDTTAVTDVYGREHQAQIRSLKPHNWLRFHDGGASAGRNPKPR
ncbi:DUF87 domain-containing protein [Pelagibius sp.]|uniref:helicase HerA domain-containing protein n=1 Tax=Pelagibius sp. TaxID=1931238 RepID=UPI002639BE95|nr:DUF87 domain-containing protein [Pelagibius sp.]